MQSCLLTYLFLGMLVCGWPGPFAGEYFVEIERSIRGLRLERHMVRRAGKRVLNGQGRGKRAAWRCSVQKEKGVA